MEAHHRKPQARHCPELSTLEPCCVFTLATGRNVVAESDLARFVSLDEEALG